MSSRTYAEDRYQTTTESIARRLRTAIERGELPPDSILPSYRSIATSYGVAINTAREAVRILVAEGHVIVRHGAGTFVRSHTPMIRFAGNRYATTDDDEMSPFRAECRRLGKLPKIDFLGIDRVRPPEDVANILAISVNSRSAICRRSLHSADGVPIQLITAYTPWTAEFGNAYIRAARSAEHQNIYGYLAALGATIARSRDVISTRMPRLEEIDHLALPPSTPVLDILHTGFDAADKSLEVTQFVMRGDESIVLVDEPVDRETKPRSDN
jgi:GntR family transcriptional regulator